MTEYIVGKMIEKPNPKCPYCRNFLELIRSIIDDTPIFYRCIMCNAKYEIKEKK